MHKFFHVLQDSYVSSGSNIATTGVSERDQNFGKDAILELKKVFFDRVFYQSSHSGESIDSNIYFIGCDWSYSAQHTVFTKSFYGYGSGFCSLAGCESCRC